MPKTTPDWYKKLFDCLGEKYFDLAYVQNTLQETGFLEELFQLPPGSQILDVGCGPGRHAIEFAKRGYRVTGLDHSPKMLKIAKELAKKEKVEISLILEDARKMSFAEEFDAAISLYEGAFSLMESDEENILILENVFHSLKQGGKFIVNVLHAGFIFRYPEQDKLFDPETCVGYWMEDISSCEGKQETLCCSNRYFTFPEIKMILENIGFRVISGFGCMPGEFKKNPIGMNDFEILVFAEK